MGWYLDSSAIAKLIIEETGSRALIELNLMDTFTSAISRIEVMRTIFLQDSSQMSAARDELRLIGTIPVTPGVITEAEMIAVTHSLKAADSIHVASAFINVTEFEGVITYNLKMAQVCKSLGMNVLSPS